MYPLSMRRFAYALPTVAHALYTISLAVIVVAALVGWRSGVELALLSIAITDVAPKTWRWVMRHQEVAPAAESGWCMRCREEIDSGEPVRLTWLRSACVKHAALAQCRASRERVGERRSLER